MRAKKLPSGSWRVRTCVKGVRRSFTASTRKEAEFLAHQYLVGKSRERTDDTVASAIRCYINDREAVLSPSTIGGYNSLARNAYDGIGAVHLDDLDTGTLQRWVSAYSRNHAPKRVRNAYGLLVASVRALRPDFVASVRLPQSKRADAHTPTEGDVGAILEYFKGRDRDMYVAVLLAAFVPMRRGEVCGLLGADVDHAACTVTVRHNLVTDDGNAQYLKQPKTAAGYRTVTLPRTIMAELPLVGPDERVVPLAPGVVSQRFKAAAIRCGQPGAHFHSLRHFGASILHAWNVPDAYIMARGGWATDVMRRVYREALDDHTRRINEEVNERIEGLL